MSVEINPFDDDLTITSNEVESFGTKEEEGTAISWFRKRKLPFKKRKGNFQENLEKKFRHSDDFKGSRNSLNSSGSNGYLAPRKYVPKVLLAPNYDQNKLMKAILNESMEADDMAKIMADALGEQFPVLFF